MLAADSRTSGTEATLMDRLRCETRAQHASAESRPLERALVGGAVTRELYAAYLVERLFIHTRLEAYLRKLVGADERFRRFVSEDLFQEANLRRDLDALGCKPPPHAGCRATAGLLALLDRLEADSPVALLGVYYVFEGSKNGARYIARAIGGALGLQPGPGLRYLDPHGAEQRARWHAVRAAVAAETWLPTESDAIVSAAQATFDAVSAIDDELWSSNGG